jgi:hypothetical protein
MAVVIARSFLEIAFDASVALTFVLITVMFNSQYPDEFLRPVPQGQSFKETLDQ